MTWKEHLKRREMRKTLEKNSFRIANEIEHAILTFIHKSNSDIYPSKHLNQILNYLEEKSKILIPSYESIDVNRAIVSSLNNRGLLGECIDIQLDSNRPNGISTGYRIPDISVTKILSKQKLSEKGVPE